MMDDGKAKSPQAVVKTPFAVSAPTSMQLGASVGVIEDQPHTARTHVASAVKPPPSMSTASQGLAMTFSPPPKEKTKQPAPKVSAAVDWD